jgi:23S rRNA pseudouridine1911/1915/1917 synthase
LKRQFLHAARLGFRHPRTKEQLMFAANLPSDLQNMLNLIRARAGLSAREY